MVWFCTYNLLDYGAGDTAEDQARYERVHQVLAGLRRAAAAAGDVLVVAVQELIARDPAGDSDPDKVAAAGARLAQLGEATGLRHQHAPNRPAIAVGNHHFHTGLLWSDDVTPAGGWRTYSGIECWHSLAVLDLDVGAAAPVRHASFHADPFARGRRADEATRVLAAMTRPEHRLPGVIGADWNSVSADRVHRAAWCSEDDGEPARWVLYDHDPYQRNPATREKLTWHPDFVYQCALEVDQHGRLSWQADRRPGETLYYGGLRDAAAALEVPWQPTTGHWPAADPYPPRRVDAVRVTSEIEPALTSCETVTTAPLRALDGHPHQDTLGLPVDPETASDHLPVLAVYNAEILGTHTAANELADLPDGTSPPPTALWDLPIYRTFWTADSAASADLDH